MAITPAQPTAVEIRLLGEFGLFESGRALKFSAPPRAASLIAYLIVHRARPASRDATAFAFWPDEDEARARANLRRHIALIVRALPASDEQAILADNRTIQWNPRYPCAIDLAQFEESSARADGVAEAIEAYRGDLLTGAYDEWILPERERLRSIHSANLEVATERYARSGDYVRAIAATRTLLLHDPWREDALRTLLALRSASGDRAGALEEYERFAERLLRELDAAPMPETLRAYESIRLGHDATGMDYLGSALERSAISATLPFVGRHDELLRLRQMWARTMRGNGDVAVVSGEAGIGKSRLLTEFGATVLAQGGTIVFGAATFPEAAPYQAVFDALRPQLTAIARSAVDPAWLAAVADGLPELRDGRDTLPRLSPLEPRRQQDRLFEAIWRCFDALAAIRPVLLVCEDMHWAGPATIDLLAYLARRSRGRPMLVVTTCRDDQTDAARPLRLLRRALRASGTFATFALGGISENDARDIVVAALGPAREPPGFAKRAHEMCSGNPFFLVEIVRDCLAAPGPPGEPAIPQSLAASIDRRIAAVSAEAQSLAGIASVVGRAFTIEIIAAAAGTSEGSCARCMDELLDVRLIHEASRREERDGDDFAFSHDLIRSQIYARLPEAARHRLHRRIGFVLEARLGGDAIAIELARHFDEGLELEKAAGAYLSSARQALRLFADDDARRALSRCVELSSDPETRADALSLREAINGRAGHRAAQLDDIEALESLAAAAGDEHLTFECMRRRILYARATDDVAGQQRWIEALRERVSAGGERAWQAFCSESWAGLMTSLGKYDDAIAGARDAAAAYGAAGDEAGSVRSLCQIADISTLRVDPAASQAALAEATAIARASSNDALIARALAASALAAYMSTDFAAARDAAERGLEICRTTGDREGEADFLFRLGNLAGRRFAVADATSFYAEATAIYHTLDKPLGQAVVFLNSGLLCLKIGAHAEALAALKAARAIFLKVNDLRGLTICALNLGMAAYLCGRYGAALRLSRTAVALARRLGNPQLECSALGNVGASERELGEREASIAHSEAALDQRRKMAPLDIGSDLADMGLTYLRAGDLDRACTIAEEVERLPPAALESVMFPQNLLWSVAQIYAAANRPEPAGRALQHALALYRERQARIPEESARRTYGLLSFNRSICEAALRNSDALRTPGGVRSEA